MKSDLKTRKKEKNKKEKNISFWVMIISLSLAVSMIIGTLLTFSACEEEPDPTPGSTPDDMPDFDYIGEDLSSYVYISPGKYKNFSVNVSIREPNEVDTEFEIMKKLYMFFEKVGDGEQKTEGTLSVADKTYIYYRGYTLGENGEKIDFNGGCNFSDDSPSELRLGSGSFITGFEYNLVGKKIEDYSAFEKIKEGTVKENQVVYISGSRTGGGKTETYTNKRIDLGANADELMGNGFKSALVGKDIGTSITAFTATLSDVEYTYSIKVSFATECEDNPIVVETYFPHDYGETSLAGKTAYFDVYVQKYVDFKVPELTDDFIKEKADELSVDLDELEAYEGANLAEKYTSYIAKGIYDTYESERRSLIESAVWEHLIKYTEIKDHPRTAVEKQFAVYCAELEELYELYSLYYSFEDFADFVRQYCGLASSADWEEYITLLAKSAVGEKLMFYYILQTEGWLPSADEYERLYNEAIDEDVINNGCVPDKYKTEAEYEAAKAELRQQLIDENGEMHYSDTAYFKYGMEKLLTGVVVNPSPSIS